ncbi:hypothetical protein H632_c3583p0 [Helicosporidium sp. ATCC 50920]|nr:hypothetical protein H632_c3583p0 [Helicosporidium sp. ATCC 50920]|eukprot:KDD72279.1 hypothetical protein H632_c3583p0 [Helicosporidium sp. ATCC 50920]
MLLDDEEVPYSIGECFVRVPREDAEQRLERAQDEARKEMKKLDNERNGVKSEMDDLKKILYAKFGNSINLDE